MKTAAFVTAVWLVILFSSCQKEFDPGVLPPLTDTTGVPDTGTQDTTGTTATFRPKTYTEDITYSGGHLTYTYNITYDAHGRQASFILVGSPGDKFLYNYAAGSYTMDIYNANVVSIHEVFFLNSAGQVDSTFQHNDTNDTTTEKYKYTNGLLTQVTEYEIVDGVQSVSEITTYQYDANKNVTKETTSGGTTTYEYDPAILNTLDLGLVYFPRNKNLPKTTTLTGDIDDTLQHTYTFDNLKRLLTEKIVSSGGDAVIKSYTY